MASRNPVLDTPLSSIFCPKIVRLMRCPDFVVNGPGIFTLGGLLEAWRHRGSRFVIEEDVFESPQVAHESISMCMALLDNPKNVIRAIPIGFYKGTSWKQENNFVQ